MSKQISTTPLAAANGAVNIASVPFQETEYAQGWTASVIVTPSAATLVAALRFFGSNAPGAIGQLTAADQAILNSIVAISALPANVTIAAGVISFASPAATPLVFIVSLGAPLPLAIRPDYAYTSGGGAVAITMNLNGYGLNS
jgi:hypothetical protein